MKRRAFVIGTALIGAGLLAGLAYLLWRYSSRAALFESAGSAIRVAILAPVAGTESAAGTPVYVRAAIGSVEPVAEVELWANGQLVGQSGAAESIGQKGFLEEISWIPRTPGDYLLVARAVDIQGHAAESSVVPVAIVQGDKDMAGESDTFLTPVRAQGTGEGPSIDELGSLTPPTEDLPVTPPGADMTSGETWAPGLAGFQAWLSGGAAPPSMDPILRAEVRDCSVRLELHDPIAHEMGFAVKRLTPGADTFQTIALLKPHTGTGWLTFDDLAPATGTSLYEVLAFDDVGAFLSNQAAVDTDPVSCPPADLSEASVLDLQIRAGVGGAGVDRLYCYVSLDGSSWQRWPANGFMTAGEESLAVQSLAGIGDTPLSLDIECWGWKGADLRLVGRAHRPKAPLEGGELLSLAGSLQLEIGPQVKLGAELLGAFESLPLHVRLPPVVAAVSYDPNACKDHLPPDAQNLLGQVLFCTPFPTYEVGEQPYLIWWAAEGQCLAGVGCLTVQQLIDRAKAEGEDIGFVVQGAQETSTPIDLSVFVVPPADPFDPYQGCPWSNEYSVRLYFGSTQGPSSARVRVHSECPPPAAVTLEVKFRSVFFGNVDDDDPVWDPQQLEVYGGLYAFSPIGSGGYLRVYQSVWPARKCPPTYLPLACIRQGPEYMPWTFCESSSLDACTGFVDQYDTIEVRVRDGDAVKVGVSLVDYDEASADDEACVVEAWTDSYSSEQWSEMDGAEFWIYQGDNGNASCTLRWTITATDVEY